MKLPLVIATMILPLVAREAPAAGPMSEARARRAAVSILMGDPYGKTAAEVARHISSASLVKAGDSICGKVVQPMWAFTVVVPAAENPSGSGKISGYLCLDAKTGKLSVAGLPFL